MKETDKMNLHPENLQEDKTYKVKFSSAGDPEAQETRIGKFLKLTLIYTSTTSLLGLKFQFKGDGLPSVIAWHRFKSIEPNTRKKN